MLEDAIFAIYLFNYLFFTKKLESCVSASAKIFSVSRAHRRAPTNAEDESQGTLWAAVCVVLCALVNQSGRLCIISLANDSPPGPLLPTPSACLMARAPNGDGPERAQLTFNVSIHAFLLALLNHFA